MKRKPMKRERAYVVVNHQTGQRTSVPTSRKFARQIAKAWGRPLAYVQPVDIIPAKGRKG